MFFFISCVSSQEISKDELIIKNVISEILEKEDILQKKFSHEQYFHLHLKKISIDNFKVSIVLNSLLPIEHDNLKKIEVDSVGVYLHKGEKLDDAFFVPDTKSWSFYVELVNKKVLIYKLSLYNSSKLKYDEINDEGW